MKKITLFLMLAMAIFAFGCSKDAEVDAFITENNAVMKDITTKIDANPSAAGVDDAQKSFDAKKDGLKTKWNAIKEARGAQVSSDMQKKLNDSIEANNKMLMDVSEKHAVSIATDGDGATKFQKLMTDYTEVFK